MCQTTLGRLTKPEVPCAEPRERGAIGSDHIGIEHVGGGDQPGVVLAHPARGATLQEGTPPRLGEVQSLDRKPPQSGECRRGVNRAFENFFDADNRDHERPAAKRGQERPRRTVLTTGRFTLERDEKRGVEQDRPAHRRV